ncbi:MAG: serine phosphatase [Acidobacteria bacterium]|nr:serine phosphatase [Acidobacteriota bacterium]
MPESRLEIKDALGRRVVPIDKDLFTIGRRMGNDLRLVGSDISREHAEIIREGSEVRIRDRGSRFGTFVNGERVSERALRPGDALRLGQSGGVEMTYQVDTGALSRADTASEHPSSLGADFRQVATLLEGLRALGSARVLDEVLAMVIDAALEMSGAERGFIMLADASGRLEFKLARARGRVTLPGKTFETSRKIPEAVFREGEFRMVADLLDGDLPAAHTGTVALGIRHVFCIPLKLVRLADIQEASFEERRIGVLYLDSRERGSLVSGAVRSGIETLATEAAVAIENARLYREAVEKARMEQELHIAAEIQQALLPPPSWSTEYFEAEGRTLPCRSIGGDFFDYLRCADGAAGFALADVSGKGAPAALLTAMIQGVLTAQAAFAGGPAAVLARVNEVLLQRALGSRFVTVFLAALAPDGALTYCNAGHNPPFLVGSGTVRRLETGGLICGLFAAATYEEETLRLHPGDTLVAFSDGVSEAANAAGEEFGDHRILDSIQRSVDRGPSGVLECLLESLRAFSAGTLQGDDITAVAVRYTGTGPER